MGCILEVPLAFAAKRLLDTPAALFACPVANGSNSGAAAAAVGTFAVAEAAADGEAEFVSATQLILKPLTLQVSAAALPGRATHLRASLTLH